jgi:hypothetical protein
MPMRLRLAVALALGISGPLAAQTAADCIALVATVENLTGLTLTAPPAATEDGACVLDGARLTGEGAPKITLQRLRIGGTVVDGTVGSLEIDGDGLRMAPALGDRDTADWLRDLMRLQSAEVHLSLHRDEDADLLVLDRGFLRLSGGAELVLKAEIAGADLSGASALTGRVTKLYLEWKNDGRTLRPMLEALGEGLKPEAKGPAAVDVAREMLRGLVAAVPESSLTEGAADALDDVILAVPQGRGRLIVDIRSEGGIGAAQAGLLALADDPASPKSLGRFFEGALISASWTPGLSP